MLYRGFGGRLYGRREYFLGGECYFVLAPSEPPG
jgi:hypothetical protein